jgi:hypothetical protein
MEIINEIKNWIFTNYGWVISLFIQGFIAYHVFFLSKKLSSRARLEHKENIKQKAEKLLSEIHNKKLNSEVYLVNINRYFKDYPSNKEKIFEDYSHVKAEIKSTRFDGVQFFCSMPVEVYRKADEKLSFKGKAKEKIFNAFPAGVVPYEWIEHVDLRGDEYGYVPLFYCHFKGKTNWNFWKRLNFFGYPYKNLDYYRESEVYHEGNDPADMKYRFIDEPISKK